EMRGPAGLVRVTDALTLRQGADLTEDAAAGRCELLRVAEGVEGVVAQHIVSDALAGLQFGLDLCRPGFPAQVRAGLRAPRRRARLRLRRFRIGRGARQEIVAPRS